MESIEPKIVILNDPVRGQFELKLCGIEWCDRQVRSRGYCANHYGTIRKGNVPVDPSAPKPDPKGCSFDGCGRRSTAKGLCASHYKMQLQGRPLVPVRPKREDLSRPGQRLCKTCQQWKEKEENFYLGSRGFYSSECKGCAIKRATAWNERAKLEKLGVSVG